MNAHEENDGEGALEHTYEDADPRAVYRALADRFDGLDAVHGREPTPRRSDGGWSTGELTVTTAETELGGLPVAYKPRGPHGALAMLVGAVFALPSFFLTLLLVAAGYLLYRVDRQGSVSVVVRTRIRLTVAESEPIEMVGDGSEEGDADDESEEEDDGGEFGEGGADDGAPMGVTVRATPATGLFVDVAALEDLEWPLRRAIVGLVREADPRTPATVGAESFEKTFFRYLNAWRTRSAAVDVEIVESTQSRHLEDVTAWGSYTDALLERAPSDVENRLEAKRGEIRSELEAVLEEVAGEL